MRRLACLMALASLFAAGCFAPLMPLESLPEQPIAFVHWSGKAASKRTSILENVSEAAVELPSDVDSARFRAEQIRAYLGGEISLPIQARLAQHPGHLSLLWPRTGEIERVEAAPPGALPLAWSSDHRRLLFASGHRGNKQQLYEYDLSRRVLRRITTGPDEHPRGDYATKPGIGKGAASEGFVVLRLRQLASDAPAESSVHRADSGGRLGPALASDVPPGALRFTGVGDRIVYEQVRVRPRRGGPAILESTIASRGLDPTAAEEVLLRGREPTLTPDGQWIVFASASSAGYRLRRMRPDGTARVPIGPGGTEERMPSVSPDGEFVVFVRMAQGKRTLAVRRFDGKGERTLVKEGSSEFPVW